MKMLSSTIYSTNKMQIDFNSMPLQTGRGPAETGTTMAVAEVQEAQEELEARPLAEVLVPQEGEALDMAPQAAVLQVSRARQLILAATTIITTEIQEPRIP
jgi:hypothetical protein